MKGHVPGLRAGGRPTQFNCTRDKMHAAADNVIDLTVADEELRSEGGVGLAPPRRKRGRPQMMTPEEKAQKVREAAVLRPALFRKHKELYKAEIERIRSEYDAQISVLKAELAETMSSSLARVSTLLSQQWKKEDRDGVALCPTTPACNS